jgi:uncharacterized membrane protein
MKRGRFDWWLAVIVLGHLAITMAHGAAHQSAHVPIARWAELFVLIVIVVGPIVGLALSIPRPRAGTALVAAAMAGSLVFGLVNHFLIVSPDHVQEVAAASRPLFATTAVLLVVSEAAGAVLALWRLLRPLEA